MKLLRWIVIIGLLTACSNKTTQHVSSLPDTGQPVLHAIDDASLREAMDRMNALMFDYFMTEDELDQQRRQYSKQISKTAAQLSQTVNMILIKLPSLNLSENDQNTFRLLAEKLKKQAQTLQVQAEQNRIDAIPGTLESMRINCTTCHQLFRQLK